MPWSWSRWAAGYVPVLLLTVLPTGMVWHLPIQALPVPGPVIPVPYRYFWKEHYYFQCRHNKRGQLLTVPVLVLPTSEGMTPTGSGLTGTGILDWYFYSMRLSWSRGDFGYVPVLLVMVLPTGGWYDTYLWLEVIGHETPFLSCSWGTFHHFSQTPRISASYNDNSNSHFNHPSLCLSAQ
jgi:hypothetical protein